MAIVDQQVLRPDLWLAVWTRFLAVCKEAVKKGRTDDEQLEHIKDALQIMTKTAVEGYVDMCEDEGDEGNGKPDMVSIMEWQKLWLADKNSEPAHLQVVVMLQATLQSFIYNHIFQDPLGERGYKDLEFPVSEVGNKNMGLSSKNTPSAISLYLFGTVTRIPIVGCLPLCKVFGQEFYIDPINHMKPDMPCWAPAWSVQVVDPSVETPTLDMRPEDLELPFTYVMKAMGTPTKIIVKLRLWKLVPKTDFVGHETVLSRPPIPEQLKKEGIKKLLEAFAAANPFQKRRGHDQKIVVTAGTQDYIYIYAYDIIHCYTV